MKENQNSQSNTQIYSDKCSREENRTSTQNSDQKEKMVNLNIEKKYRNFKYTSLLTKIEWNKCLSFAFNKNNTILFIGSELENIVVYGFNNNLKKISLLKQPFNFLKVCLIYLQNSHQLVSQSKKSITIWDSDHNLWKGYQKLGFMTPQVSSMVINGKEDLLIAGGFYNMIRFWRKVNLRWNVCQVITTKSIVFSLSLNDSETNLISCGGDEILVIELQSDKSWKIIQTIEVNECGYRLCFINDNQFVFQPKSQGTLEIFDYENERKQFVNTKNVQVQKCVNCDYFFPCQFIQSKNILMIKHGKYVNLFFRTQNGDFVLEQAIEFLHDNEIYGRLTDDGSILVTWDRKIKKLQVRKLMYLE